MNNLTCTFPECERPHQRGGLCKGHNRQIQEGRELKPIRRRIAGTFRSTREALEAHTVRGDGCWSWSGPHDRNGYPLTTTKNCSRMAYRAWFELTREAVPEDMQVDHICHNRGCVNPDHLRLLTIKQNAEHRKGANSNSKTGVRGVWWSESMQRYVGHVEHNGKRVMNRKFKTLEEAEAAVIAKRLEVFSHSDVDRVKA